MSPSTLLAIEEADANKLTAPYKRSFEAGILLVTYSSLRFSDPQRILPFEVDEDSMRGALFNLRRKSSMASFGLGHAQARE